MDDTKVFVKKKMKFMTMHEALHSRDDVDRLYVSLKEGGRVLGRIEDSVNASIQRHEYYKEKRKRRLITTTKNNIDNIRITRT